MKTFIAFLVAVLLAQPAAAQQQILTREFLGEPSAPEAAGEGGEEVILTTTNALNERFIFSEDKLYTILTLPLVPTQIVLSSEEEFVGLYAGDTQRWEFDQQGRFIFIKPITHGISVVAQIVTTKRSYSVLLIAGEAGDKYHYRVAWDHPALVGLTAAKSEDDYKKQSIREAVDEEIALRKQAQQQEQDVIVANENLLLDMNMSYETNGNASLLPTLIMDDGKRTFMLFSDFSELPAIYNIVEGEQVLPNYNKKNDFLIFDRVGDWEFRLGNKSRAGALRR